MNARWLRPLCAGALALTSLLARAQYSWIDEKGSRVFSDRPPPPGTPAAKILKTPRGLAPLDAPAPATAPAPASQAQAAAPDWQKREADYRERSAKREKDEREADAKSRQERAAQCTWARGAQKQLETVRKLEWTNKKGEQEIMSDEDRGREQQRAQRLLANCS
jgi:hypothetical protein